MPLSVPSAHAAMRRRHRRWASPSSLAWRPVESLVASASGRRSCVVVFVRTSATHRMPMLVEATSSVGACTPPAADEPRAVVCDLGDLHVGDSVDVSVAVQAEAPAGATLTAVAQTASTVTDPDTTDNLVALDTEVVPAG